MRPRVLVASFVLFAACSSPRVGAREPEHATRGPTDRSTRSRCADAALGVEVLGSGGPILDDGRASSGYVVWVEGRARLLVDLGPGAMLRLAESGADPADLDAILFTHLHVDHAGDFDAFLKTASFGDRARPLAVCGPTGADPFPSLDDFLGALLAEGGAFHYLGGALDEGRPFALAPRALDPSRPEPIEAFESERLRVRAIGVPHGPVPALAYEVEVGDARIAFMGDQRADEARYVDLVRGADLLVAHMAVGAEPSPAEAHLHASPARLGEVARDAEVGRMVLSHLMARSLADLDGNLAAIRERYAGPTEVAEDGLCVRLR